MLFLSQYQWMTNHRIYKERMKRISSFPYSLHLFESLEFLIIFVSSNPPSSSPNPSSFSPNPSSSSPCPSSSSAFRRFSSEYYCSSSALLQSSAPSSSWAISALKCPQQGPGRSKKARPRATPISIKSSYQSKIRQWCHDVDFFRTRMLKAREFGSQLNVMDS